MAEVEAPNGSMHMKIDRPGIHIVKDKSGTTFWLDTHLASTARLTHAGRK